MKLKEPCEHDAYDPHDWVINDFGHTRVCPGGEFLADVAFKVQLSTDEDVESLDFQYWHQDLTDFVWAKGGWTWFVLVPIDTPDTLTDRR